jgi:hypothetical protein
MSINGRILKRKGEEQWMRMSLRQYGKTVISAAIAIAGGI